MTGEEFAREAHECEVLSRWLDKDLTWLDDLSGVWFNGGLHDEDREWLRAHLELAGRPVPTIDTSWIQMEWIR